MGKRKDRDADQRSVFSTDSSGCNTTGSATLLSHASSQQHNEHGDDELMGMAEQISGVEMEGDGATADGMGMVAMARMMNNSDECHHDRHRASPFGSDHQVQADPVLSVSAVAPSLTGSLSSPPQSMQQQDDIHPTAPSSSTPSASVPQLPLSSSSPPIPFPPTSPTSAPTSTETKPCFGSWFCTGDTRSNDPITESSKLSRQPNRQHRNANAAGDTPFTSAQGEAMSSQSESLLVKELNALSIHERQQVYEDIHGVAVPIEESPDMIANALEKLDQRIKRIKHRSSYDRAFFLSPAQVMDAKFRLDFLRAENFEINKAAKRLVNYFELRLELFGVECLARPVTYDDLQPEDHAYLRSGSTQIIGADQVGRPVILAVPKQRRSRTEWISMSRSLLYLSALALREFSESSQKGVILLVYDSSMIQGVCANELCQDRRFRDASYLQGSNKLLNAVPAKLSAVHFCYDNPQLAVPMHALQLMIGHQGRVRFRAHFGSHLENLYKLMTFGIPTQKLPIQPDGKVSTQQFHAWLDGIAEKERQQLQQQRKLEAIHNRIAFPERDDILCGRGRPFQDFPGNISLGVFVDSYYDQYQLNKKSEKTQLSMKLVKLLRKRGVRVLKRRADEGAVDEHGLRGVWEMVDNERAREKVSHTFRNTTLHRNALNKQQQKQQQQQKKEKKKKDQQRQPKTHQ